MGDSRKGGRMGKRGKDGVAKELGRLEAMLERKLNHESRLFKEKTEEWVFPTG